MIVLAIPDLHEPFAHPHAYDFLSDLKNEYKPDIVVCLGDEVDMHAVSNWGQDPDGMSPGDETRTAKRSLKQLFKLFPKALCCVSNHTSRPYRRAYASGMPGAFIRSYNEIYDAPSTWRWEQSIFIEGVEYFHGEGMGQKTSVYSCLDKKKHSCVFGHVHAHGGAYYNKTSDGRLLFGLNAGCLINEEDYAFNYAKNFPFKPTLGAGIVIDGHAAHFIPLSAEYDDIQENTKTSDFVEDFIIKKKK